MATGNYGSTANIIIPIVRIAVVDNCILVFFVEHKNLPGVFVIIGNTITIMNSVRLRAPFVKIFQRCYMSSATNISFTPWYIILIRHTTGAGGEDILVIFWFIVIVCCIACVLLGPVCVLHDPVYSVRGQLGDDCGPGHNSEVHSNDGFVIIFHHDNRSPRVQCTGKVDSNPLIYIISIGLKCLLHLCRRFLLNAKVFTSAMK